MVEEGKSHLIIVDGCINIEYDPEKDHKSELFFRKILYGAD